MHSLSDLIDEGAHGFRRAQLDAHPDLFSERAALFFTPTCEIPPQFVGRGPLDVALPVPIPSWLEYRQIPGLASPRFWVDQIQRATGLIRWQPIDGAVDVQFTVTDCYARGAHLMVKAVLDALKLGTAGRRDGRRLHYFGTMVDDGWKYIGSIDVVEEVSTCSAAGCRIRVNPAASSPDSSVSTHRIVMLDKA